MLSVTDLGWGSVIGNSLDHGVTYMPYGADFGCRAGWRSCSPTASCCAPAWARCTGNTSWHLYKRGLGPSLDQLFMQSNFGIVTKMGVWLMPDARGLHADVAARSGATTTSSALDRHAAPSCCSTARSRACPQS